MLKRLVERRRNRALAAQQRGMTLLEIMIVLAIIALVMGLLVGPKVLSSLGSAQKKTYWMTAKQFAEEAYPRWRADNPGKTCPGGLADLTKYMNQKELKDDEGNELYIMLCGSNAPEGVPNKFGVIYVGEDKKSGTEDDIKSWEKAPTD